MMNFREYEEMIRKTPYTKTLEFQPAFMWLHRERLPLGVVSIGDPDSNIIKIPGRVTNSYGRSVSVIAISKKAFSGKSNLTDIILPQSIERLPEEAFMGCTSLKRICITRKIKRIEEGCFRGCSQLEDIYYEGSMEEWMEISIVHQKHEIEFGDLLPGTPVHEIKAERMINIPGNEAVFSANIHFHCSFSEQRADSAFTLRAGNKDITELFRTI